MRKINGFKRIRVQKPGKSETIIKDDNKRFKASDFKYRRKVSTPRQDNFYQNLRSIYQLTGSSEIPFSFIDEEGNKWRLDKGCVGMAIEDKSLAKLKNDSKTGVVETVILIIN